MLLKMDIELYQSLAVRSKEKIVDQKMRELKALVNLLGVPW